MFIIAVISIVLAIDLVVAVLVSFGTSPDDYTDPTLALSVERMASQWHVLVWSSVGVLLLIGGSSLFRIMQLSAGGGAVAESVGGHAVTADTSDYKLRRLRNVVEEVALASGVPVPQVYVLPEERGINAFAAGFSTSDAAIAVSAGCIEHLSRDELQGVVAHEFSHILNGDMRLNVRLMGVLFGILVLGIIGRHLVRSARYGSRNKNGGGIVFAGLAIMVIGYVGVFFGNMIKAAVSRQREYLADASAVQFTRNPDGIAGALKKIGALSEGSTLEHSDAQEVSHMLFASGFSQLFSTHPPLIERIEAIDPSFDPKQFEQIARQLANPRKEPEEEPVSEDERKRRVAGLGAVVAASAAEMMRSVGDPGWSHVELARELRRSVPKPLAEAVRKPEAAITVVCGLLLSEHAEVAQRQTDAVRRVLGEKPAARLAEAHRYTAKLPAMVRLPLVELASAAIKEHPRHVEFAALLDELIEADGTVDVFEYALARLVKDDLDRFDHPSRRQQSISKLHKVEQEIVSLFSVMASHGQDSEDEARRAFNAGVLGLLPQSDVRYAPPEDWMAALDQALSKLDRLKPMLKQDVVEHLMKTVLADGEARLTEVELLRAVCAALQCPVPPLLP